MTSHANEKYSQLLRDELMDLDSSIRAEVVSPLGGKIVTMGFPGLAFDIKGATYLDPERMDATLLHPAMAQCRTLCVLLESAELPDDGLNFLTKRCAMHGISVLHVPIVDYHAPDVLFEEKWAHLSHRILAQISEGGTLGLTCHYGAGRSGMMATYLLMQSGVPLANAVSMVRDHFPDSIENDIQMQWLEQKWAEFGTPPQG